MGERGARYLPMRRSGSRDETNFLKIKRNQYLRCWP